MICWVDLYFLLTLIFSYNFIKMKKIKNITQKSNIKRIVIEIFIWLTIIWYFWGYWYLLVVTYFLFHFLFLKFKRPDHDLLDEFLLMVIVFFQWFLLLLKFYHEWQANTVLFFYLIIFLVTILLKWKK
jgi:CDP-diglyceride synthetase